MAKILILANNDVGLYKFRKELIEELVKENEVYISLPNGEFIPRLIEMGCKFVDTHIDRRGTKPIRDLKLILYYLRILRRITPEVVLAYTIKPNIYGGVACRLLNIPCINNITGLGSVFNGDSYLKYFISKMYKVSLKKSYCVFFQNTSDMQVLLDNNTIKGNYEVIPGSGVNLDEFQYKELPQKENSSFLFIGRIMKDKGIDEYLEAAKLVKEKYPEASFILIGFVEQTQQHYEEKIQDFEKRGYIKYYGYQTDVKPYIEETQCLIQASHGGEGLSNVLLESGAIGRALIASNIPGCRETIEEEKNGYLFLPNNPKDLAKKIEKFINLPHSLKVNMGNYSRQKVEMLFDRNIVVNTYMKKINKICQKENL